MTVQEFLKRTTNTLKQAGVESARLDALVLLEDALGQDRARLLAHPETEIPTLTETKLNTKIMQRASHRPLAYIRGKAPFYGREFLVDARVLVPRPETEIMIELLVGMRHHSNLLAGVKPSKNHQLFFIDVGCGSGCIGITAALEVADAEVELRDIDPGALEIAAANARLHNVRPAFRQVNLLQDPPSKRADAIFANLPYVPSAHPINRAAQHEPKLALFGGQDGLELYRRLWREISGLAPSHKPDLVFTEALPVQHQTLCTLAMDAGYRLVEAQNLVQVFRLS